MPIECYTDASYSKEKSFSVVAYKIHDEPIQTIIYENVKNTEAELNGILHCIDYCLEHYPNQEITIYTDCQSAFKQDYSGKPVVLNLVKVKGHQPRNTMNEKDLIFKSVDKMARKAMRVIRTL